MERTALTLLVLFLNCIFGLPQVKEIFYRRTTTPDPVHVFFSICDPRNAHCIRSQDCDYENILDGPKCSSIGHVCCKKKVNPIVFPENNTPRPITRSTTTSSTPIVRTKPSTRAPTRVTTEDPFAGGLPADCGVQQSNLSHSLDVRDSERGEFPWNVEIFSKVINVFGIMQHVFHCGGTIIDDFVVVTSPNCENLRNTAELFISAAVWNLDDLEEKRQIRKVAQIIKHPRFEHGTRISSIALLILEDQVDFARHVNRICLPEPEVDFTDSLCFVTGWGGNPGSNQTIRPRMKVVEMQLVERNKCISAIRRTIPRFELNQSFQCAKEESGNHLCPYDVGSPLFCTIPGRRKQFYQVGVFVWNHFVDQNGACHSGLGVVNLFVKIQDFRQWIDDEMEKINRDINIYIPQPDEGDEYQTDL